MRRIVALFAVLIAMSFLAVGQYGSSDSKETAASNTKVQDELMKLERERSQAVIKGDTAFLDRSTADDYTIINANGQLSNKQQTLDAIKSGAIKVESNDLDDLNVRVYGNTAVVTGRSTLKGMNNGQDVSGQNRFTRVYVKQNGRWQSVAFQQTRIANQ
jgi:ketosteroid isomerase-like protein